jgi:hypothetical protein
MILDACREQQALPRNFFMWTMNLSGLKRIGLYEDELVKLTAAAAATEEDKK